MAFFSLLCRCEQMWRNPDFGKAATVGPFGTRESQKSEEKFAQLTEASRPFLAGLPVKHTGRGSKRARLQRGSLPGDSCLSRSVCWHSLTPLTFSLNPYQNVFLSHTPVEEALQPTPPPPVPSSRSSCSTLWSECDCTCSNSWVSHAFLFFMSRNKFRMCGEEKK